MKPFELIYALMRSENIGPLPLAKKLGKPGLQAPIQRFSRGEVLEPARSTAGRLATYFRIPVDAIYDEKVATAVAKERGLTVAHQQPKQARRGRQMTLPLEAGYANLSEERKRIVDFLLHCDGEPAPSQVAMWRNIEKDYRKRVSEDPDGATGNTRPGALGPDIDFSKKG